MPRRDTVRRELEETVANAAAKKQVEVDYALKVLERAEVDASVLTGSPEWDAYLQQLQALNEKDEQVVEFQQSHLREGRALSGDALQSIHFYLALAQARIEARNECIQIPKRILREDSQEN